MKKYGPRVFLVMVFVLLLLPVATLAQEPTPDFSGAGPDYDATARALEWRAQSARATAEAAHVQATAQAATATARAEAGATATAEAIRAEATATAASIDATATASAQMATVEAGHVLATREAEAWTLSQAATIEALRIEATTTALELERARREADRDKATGALVTYVSYAALLLAGLFAIWASHRLIERIFGAGRSTGSRLGRRGNSDRGRPRQHYAGGEIIDVGYEAEPDRSSRLRQSSVEPSRRGNGAATKIVLALPPSTDWKPAYLRPKQSVVRPNSPQEVGR